VGSINFYETKENFFIKKFSKVTNTNSYRNCLSHFSCKTQKVEENFIKFSSIKDANLFQSKIEKGLGGTFTQSVNVPTKKTS